MNAHRPQTKFPQERLMSVLLAPIISEKATFIADKHEQVVFRVAQDATKPEVKAAVELMYEFLDRLITVALPRVRDFRGVSGKGFDGQGNYNMPCWNARMTQSRHGHIVRISSLL